MANRSAMGRVKPRTNEMHHEGWDRALDLALSKLSGTVGPGKYTVRVEFTAGVEVSNPGNIGWYKVTLTP